MVEMTEECENNKQDECGVCFGSGEVTWYLDQDNDGLGDPSNLSVGCLPPCNNINDDDYCDERYVNNDDDTCPLDYDNDQDGDSLCGDKDICPKDKNNDDATTKVDIG